jgi:hypothetical protein
LSCEQIVNYIQLKVAPSGALHGLKIASAEYLKKAIKRQKIEKDRSYKYENQEETRMKNRLMLFFMFITAAHMALSQCDLTLSPSENTKIAYKTRGNRCEGAYAAKVGAPTLDVVGFTVGKFSYKLEKDEIITIENMSGGNIFIRASAIPLHTYYRMDAALQKDKALTWEIKDVLLSLNIPSNLLGVYAWSGTEKNKLFSPVTALSSTTNKMDKNLYFLIRPSSKVLGVKYRYARDGENFPSYQNVVTSGKAGEPILILLPENLSGKYHVDIAAMLESKSDWVTGQYMLSIK